MLNYQQIGTEYLKQLQNNTVAERYINFATDLWVASLIEWYYGPMKFLTKAQDMDFSVWPSNKIVDTLYNDLMPGTQSLCG